MEQKTMEQMISVHEAELGLVKSDFRDLEQLVEGMCHVVALLGETQPGEATDCAAHLRSLLFERIQRVQQRPARYMRGTLPPLGEEN
jgi:hypothetical protein